MKFGNKNSDLEQQEAREFIALALMRQHKGNTQDIHDSLPDFMASEEATEILRKLEALKSDVYTAWLASRPKEIVDELSVDTPAAEEDGLADALLEDEELLGVVSDPVVEDVENFEEIEEFENGEAETPEESPEEFAEPENKSEENEVEEEPEAETEEPVAEEEDTPLTEEEDSEIEAPVSEEDSVIDPEPSGMPGMPGAHGADQPESGSENVTDAPVDESGAELPPPPIPEKRVPIPVKLNLPNAKVGQPYSQSLNLEPLKRNLEAIESIETSGLSEAGLTFDRETLALQGTPEEPGKFPLSILIAFGPEPDKAPQEYRLQAELDIIPDPRRLWKELEPPADSPYPKEHTQIDQIRGKARTLIAASRRGRAHAHSGTFRDDHFTIAYIPESDWYLVAVADGAGSANFSRRGAEIACETAVSELRNALTGEFERQLVGLGATHDSEEGSQSIRRHIYQPLSNAAFQGYKSILAEAEDNNVGPKAYHTTLLLAMVKKFDFGWFVGSYWVGDGGAGVYRKEEAVDILGTPDGGDFAGQTRFLTMREIWADGETIFKRIEFRVVPDFTALVLMSDGITDPKFQTDHNLLQVEKWDAFWAELNDSIDFAPDNADAAEQLLEWLNFWSPGDHDDRTIAILF